MITSTEAIEKAKRFTQVDTAALLMAVHHVRARICELAELGRDSDPQTSSQLDGLAAQLEAGLNARPATVWLDLWSARLTAANGTPAGKGVHHA